MSNKKTVKKITIPIMLLVAFIMCTTQVFAGTAHQLELHKKQMTDNVAFKVENMFPGDVVVNNYNVRVSHKDAAKIHFKAEVTKDEPYEVIEGVNDQGAKLADVLNVKVVLKNTGKVLYEGTFADMPASMSYDVPAAGASKKTDVEYEITATLDTSVGNEYQAYILAADFTWWVDSEDKDALVQTGDDFPVALIGAIAAAALIARLVLTRRKKKEA